MSGRRRGTLHWKPWSSFPRNPIIKMIFNVCCLLTSGKNSAEEPEEGKESLENSSNENEVRQNCRVAKLAYRQYFQRSFHTKQKAKGQLTCVPTGIAGGQLWGRAGLWRSYILHRIWGCHSGLPTSSSISVHVKLVIRGLVLHSSSFWSQVLVQKISLLEGLGFFCGSLLQAACPFALSPGVCSVLCLHLRHIYSQGSGASVGNWSFSNWRALQFWRRFIIGTFLGCLA